MNKKTIITLGCTVLTMGSSLAESKSPVAPGPNEPTLESLQANYVVPEWFRDAKFGIYTHWGPVTHAIQHPDEKNIGRFGWYGSQLYRPGTGGHEYHKKYWGDPKEVNYRAICEKFTADDFDAEHWADVFEMAGAKFAGPVSVHHDNFLMWDSELNPFCAGKMGPKRDICGEVATAVRKRGMKFIGTFHHGFSYRYWENAWKYDPGHPELYGPEHHAVEKYIENDKGERVKNDAEWKHAPREWQEYWRDAVGEFVDNYQPDLIWFDFGLSWQDRDIQLQMYANFYNKARSYGQDAPTVARKARDAESRTYGTLDLERGHMPRLTEYPWLSDTSASAWFYYPNPTTQPDDSLVDMYVDIVAKNGTLLLNIGPDYKGTFPEEFMTGLRAIGAFNETCGEGIYDSRPWLTYGEGHTKTSTGHKGAANSLEHATSNFQVDDKRYTQSKDGKNLYAWAMHWPEGLTEMTFKSVIIEGEEDGAKIELLGHGPVEYSTNADKSVTVKLPAKAPNPHCNGFKFSNIKVGWHPYGHHLIANSTRIDLSAAKDSKDGVSVEFESGSVPSATLWIGSKTAAKGTATLYEGSKKIMSSDYSVDANGHVEVGDFKVSAKKVKKEHIPAKLRLEITGLKATDLDALSIGIQRDKTILRQNDSIQ